MHIGVYLGDTSAATWYDNAYVMFLSSTNDIDYAAAWCYRKGRNSKGVVHRMRVMQPGIAKDFSQHMGGVDIQLVYYS